MNISLQKNGSAVSGSHLKYNLIALPVVLGIVLGLIILLADYRLVVAGGIGVVLIAASCMRPALGVLVIIGIIASIVFEEGLPYLTIGTISLHFTDIILLLLVAKIVYELIVSRDFHLARTPADVPLLLFLAIALTSTLVAVYAYDVDFNIAMREFRHFAYYLMFFIVTSFVRDKKTIKFILNVMFGIATVVAAVMIIQAIIGPSIQLMPGRVEAARTFGTTYQATRILPPGQLLLYVSLITVLCEIFLVSKGSFQKSYRYLFLITFGGAILLTFNRSYWVTILFCLVILVCSSTILQKARMIVVGVVFLALLVLAVQFGVLRSDKVDGFIQAVAARVESLYDAERIMHSATIKWRKMEHFYAAESIKDHPLIGIGLGNEYRPYYIKPRDDLTRYIHNGYYGITLKTGFLGLAAYLCFFILSLVRGVLYWKRVDDHALKTALVGFSLSATGIMIAVIINPIFLQWYSIVIIATMFGLNEAIIRLHKSETHMINE